MPTGSVSFSGDQRNNALRFSVVKLENKSQTIRFSSRTSPLKIHIVMSCFDSAVIECPKLRVKNQFCKNAKAFRFSQRDFQSISQIIHQLRFIKIPSRYSIQLWIQFDFCDSVGVWQFSRFPLSIFNRELKKSLC